MSGNSAKRLCTVYNKDRGRTEDGGELASTSFYEICSINSRLPLEMIEMILVEVVVTQTLHSSTTTCAIKKCSRHDDNLALVCPLWQKIVDGRRFREIVLQRISKIDPKALYTQRAQQVIVTGLDEIVNVAVMNDVIYTIECDDIDDLFIDDTRTDYIPSDFDRPGLIFAYDIDFIHHRSARNRESFSELKCTNRRQLSTVAGVLDVSMFLSSPSENCLFVQSLSSEFPGSASRIYKLARDGAVVTHWRLDPELYRGHMTIDSLGQRLVVSGYYVAHVFTSLGLHIATITLDDFISIRSIGILADSTIIVKFGKFESVNVFGFEFFQKIVFLRATKTSTGLLDYQSVSDAVASGGCALSVKTDWQYSGGEAVLCDGDGPDGCVLVLLEKGLMVMDKERKTILTAKDLGKGKEFLHFDESHGLMFFLKLNMHWRRPKEFCVFQVRHRR